MRAVADDRSPIAASRGFESITGKGVRGEVEGRRVALGNRALMDAMTVDLGELAATAEELRGDGQTVMFVAIDGRPAGLIGVADPSIGTRAAAESGRRWYPDSRRLGLLRASERERLLV